MTKKIQYGYTLECGRRGATLQVMRLDIHGVSQFTWQAIFNSRGMRVTRTASDGTEVELTSFESFLYPDRVEDDELLFMDALSMSPVAEDHRYVRLCSQLVAEWAAGHDEESMHDTIRSTLDLWSKETTSQLP